LSDAQINGLGNYETSNDYDALEKTGASLTRAAFVRATEAATVNAGFGAVLSYAPNNHFGADTVHVLKVDCGQRRYVTLATNAKY
jgi:predicted RNA-binding protein with EMAP domain